MAMSSCLPSQMKGVMVALATSQEVAREVLKGLSEDGYEYCEIANVNSQKQVLIALFSLQTFLRWLSAEKNLQCKNA